MELVDGSLVMHPKEPLMLEEIYRFNQHHELALKLPINVMVGSLMQLTSIAFNKIDWRIGNKVPHQVITC